MAPAVPPPALSILIVDDNKANQFLLKSKIEDVKDWNPRVDTADDGEQSLKLLKETFYDLVFLDYRLPGMDGLGVLNEIRQLHEKTAVVIVTAVGTEQVAVQAMKMGAMDYVTHDEMARLDPGQFFRRLIEHRKLVNENMELRQINQMKSEFIANVSHELRTPLAVILGYANIMREKTLGPLSAEQEKAMHAIIGRAEGLLVTLNKILEVREATEGGHKALLSPTDLRELLAAFAATGPKELARKGMTLHVSLGDAPAWVLADEPKLLDVLDNLLMNAVKFGPQGSSVSLALQLRGGQALVSLNDQGPGIQPERLPHLFEPLNAAREDPTRQYPGLGLGLALAKEIVELHSGRIWLESRGAGQGTTAFVSLPLAAPDSAGGVVERRAPVAKKRVLLVEDNHDLLDVLKLFMSSISHNFQIETAYSGFEALEKLKPPYPDLMIVDAMMPGMDGFQLIERVRKAPQTANIPIMLLTGYEEALKRAAKAGAQEVLMKPFQKEVFISKVLRLLGSPAARG
jgi:signal transduction histidine kinase